MTKSLSPARLLAFDLLQDIFYQGAFANIALDKALFTSSMDKKDKALTTELVYGTVKYRDRLTYMIDQFSNRPIKKMDQKTAVILLMGAYQLDQLSRIPNHAVVYEAVNLAKSQGLSSAKLINAVLRAMIRDAEAITWPDPRKQKASFLAKTESFPQWMMEAFIKKFGYDRTKALCQYFNAPAPLWLRTHDLRIGRSDLLARLEKEGVKAEPGRFTPESIRFLSGPALRDLASFQEGLYTVQDQAAILVGHALAPQAGERVLDMCAGPGGKTTHLATLMKDQGDVLALDLHPHRTQLVEEAAQRLSLTNIRCESRDASLPDPDREGTFDRVLLDAPCSGLGVLNRRPDSRWHKRRGDIPGLVALQAKLFDQAAAYLKPGGRLVYATCTLLDEENKDQVRDFLSRHPDFSLVSDLDHHWQDLAAPDGMLELHPDIHGTDGFFIAGLQKGGGA